mgnify:CR=1 FL=1
MEAIADGRGHNCASHHRIHGSGAELELEALVGIVTEARGIGEQLSGKFFTGSASNLKFAEISLNAALQALNELLQHGVHGGVELRGVRVNVVASIVRVYEHG